MEKGIKRQRVLLEHLRPSSSHSFKGSLSVLLLAWLGTVLRTRGPLSMEMMLSLSRHIGLHFASPNVATSRILFLMITLQVQMWHRHQTKRVKDIFCPHVWRSTMGFCSESVRFEGGGRNIRLGLNRTGKSCRLRWVNYLHPGLKRGKMTNR
ncbi:PREDICTED: uncharacterized protein LOC106303970 isoform X1 [Brassica oleracea var. oleracea]|uniref:uncharacterized protein LOC106303970 isoform X1 n=2 Tax=Brassica oleracea var. oleracea TaxID=109376 RepID=UPI0006A6B894|nr:PREDICTED: uncharacterized protein LOC106303970 isoform X1 [Brassica oleracea var. oleracea]